MIPERRGTPRFRLETGIDVNRMTERTLEMSATGVSFAAARRFTEGDDLCVIFQFTHSRLEAIVRCTAGLLVFTLQGIGAA